MRIDGSIVVPITSCRSVVCLLYEMLPLQKYALTTRGIPSEQQAAPLGAKLYFCTLLSKLFVTSYFRDPFKHLWGAKYILKYILKLLVRTWFWLLISKGL